MMIIIFNLVVAEVILYVMKNRWPEFKVNKKITKTTRFGFLCCYNDDTKHMPRSKPDKIWLKIFLHDDKRGICGYR